MGVERSAVDFVAKCAVIFYLGAFLGCERRRTLKIRMALEIPALVDILDQSVLQQKVS